MLRLVEILTLFALVGGIGFFAVSERSEWLTPVMLALVGVVWLLLTAAAWSRTRLAVADDAPLAGWLLDRARSSLLQLGDVDRLPEGASARLVNEAASAPAWRLPWWWSTGQSVLISLGLVGTFLGLSLGLVQALPTLTASGEQASTVQMEGMRTLFLYAQLAFVKSLAGVWCGMVWGPRLRWMEEVHEDELREWADWLDRKYPPVSVLELMATASRARADHQRRLSEQLTELDRGLRQAVEQTRTDIVAGVDRTGTMQVDRLVTEIENASMELLDHVGQLAEALPGKIGSNTASVLDPQFEALARALKQLSDAGGRAIGSAFETSLASESEGLRKSLSEVTALLQRLGPQITAQLDAADRRVQDGANQAASALVDAGTAASLQLQGAAAQFSAETNSIQAAMGAVRETLAEAHTVARALRGAGVDVTSGLQGIAQELQVLPPVLDRARVALDASGAAVANSAETTRTVNAQAERAVLVLERLAPANEALLDRSERLTGEVDRVRAASEALAAALTAMTAGQQAASAESFRALSETAAKFGASLEQAQANVTQASRSTFDDARSLTGDAARQLADVLTSGSKRLEDALEKLSAYSAQIDRGLQAAEITIGSIDDRARALRSSAEAVSAPFGEVARALERVAPEVRQASDAVQAERTALTGLGRQLEAQGELLTRAGSDLSDRVREQQALQVLLSREWAEHVKGVEALLDKVRAGWTDALRAANVGVEKNAKEIAEYAQAVERSLRLPRDLTNLSETIDELNDVLSDVATKLRPNP